MIPRRRHPCSVDYWLVMVVAVVRGRRRRWMVIVVVVVIVLRLRLGSSRLGGLHNRGVAASEGQ